MKMKRITGLLTAATIMAATVLTGCSLPWQKPDLTGEWTVITEDDDSSPMSATVTEDSIRVYWGGDDSGVKALYWAGSYVAPTSSAKEYSWESENYTDETGSSLLASGDDIKTFRYSDGKLSFDMTMMGVSATITMEKTGDAVATSQTDQVNNENDSDGDEETDTTSANSEEESATDGESSKTTADSQNVNTDNLESQIAIDTKKTQDGQLAVFLTNNSGSNINRLDVQANYLDDAGSTIDVDTDSIEGFLAGSTVVSIMSTPDAEYSDVDYELEINDASYITYENHAKDIAVESNPGDKCVIVKLTNNSDATIDRIEYVVVLLKENQLVSVTSKSVRDVAPGDTETEKVNMYSHETFRTLENGTDYDTIKVYLNCANTKVY